MAPEPGVSEDFEAPPLPGVADVPVGFGAGLASGVSFDPPLSPEVLDSVAFDSDGLAPEAAAVSELPLSELPVGDESAASAFFVAELRASRLAHPLPLNRMAGVETCFFNCPPQTSHVVGRGAWMPCITSMLRPHCVQT